MSQLKHWGCVYENVSVRSTFKELPYGEPKDRIMGTQNTWLYLEWFSRVRIHVYNTCVYYVLLILNNDDNNLNKTHCVASFHKGFYCNHIQYVWSLLFWKWNLTVFCPVTLLLLSERPWCNKTVQKYRRNSRVTFADVGSVFLTYILQCPLYTAHHGNTNKQVTQAAMVKIFLTAENPTYPPVLQFIGWQIWFSRISS